VYDGALAYRVHALVEYTHSPGTWAHACAHAIGDVRVIEVHASGFGTGATHPTVRHTMSISGV
jgi:hypothetical protein